MKEKWCKHAQGPRRGMTCALGLTVEKVDKRKVPCYRDDNIPCDSYEEPTQKEIEERRAKMLVYIKESVSFASELKAYAKKNNLRAGEYECPKCKDKVNFTISSHNGHMWAVCKTKGCYSWAE